MNYKHIIYSLTFHTDWHSGSGQSRGADVDALVVKDRRNLPYIPGKTIKGLLREAMEELMFLTGKENDEEYRKQLVSFFGNSADHNLLRVADDAAHTCMSRGCGFFTNACLESQLADEICKHNASRFLYREKSQTKIDREGIAVDHSLRKIEAVVPCILYGEIHDIPEALVDDLIQSLGFIKRMGLDRNRGLGRCTFQLVKEGGKE